MKITDNTKGVLAAVSSKVTKTLEKIKPVIVNSAKENVPVVSGNLQRSIDGEVSENKLVVGSPLEYAPKIESDSPYLRPALHGNIPFIKKAFEG